MPKSKFFRVAVEGATSDVRKIEGKILQEMADSYNPATYAARVNMEHIRGITADPPFQSLGDVLALKTEQIDLPIGGKTEKRLALFAQIEALPPLIAMNRKKQKLFTSVEIAPNFAQTGKAYLVGLAVTDSPASLGTEMLEFCAKQGDKSPLAGRKQDAANLFTAADETVLELDDAATTDADPTGVLASMKAMFDKFVGQPAGAAVEEKPKEEPAPAPAVAATPDAAAFAAFGAALNQMATSIDALAKATTAQIGALSDEVAAVKQAQEETPAGTYRQRPAATGGDGAIKAQF